MEAPIHELKLPSPIGPLRLRSQTQALVGIYFAEHKRLPRSANLSAEPCGVLLSAADQLTDYFSGRRWRFEVPLAPHGTPFQLSVWHALETIEPGAPITYSQLANRIGRPRACRAVGAANSRNPLSIVLPCHRVIGVGGQLTGYAGGLAIKQWLLAHEAKHFFEPRGC